MTYFLGGKKRIGDEMAKTIYAVSKDIEYETTFKIKGYCEPFCGMMGVYRHIPDLFKNKIKYKAGDRNPYLIKLWKGLQKGFSPPTTCTKKEYYNMKDKDDKSLKAIFLGFACAIRGVFRSTFNERNIEAQAEECKEIGKIIKNVDLHVGEYSIFSNLKGYVIYCDPPYKGSISPYSIGNVYNTKFDYDLFTEWCRDMSKDNIVFISDYQKPCKECELVWSKGKEKLYLAN